MKTPLPPLDVPQLFPFLAGRERVSFRMHPRRAEGLPLFASKLGGPMAWPREVPVPQCPDNGLAPVPVLQLRRDAGLPLPFPDGTDLFQLLWYPAEYEDELYLPRLLGYFRSLAQLAEHVVLTPSYPDEPMGYEVQQCSVTFEPVTEYPVPTGRQGSLSHRDHRDPGPRVEKSLSSGVELRLLGGRRR